MAIAYARFLIHLPRRTCVLFLLAGAVYVGGALGMEMVAAVYDQSHGYENAVTASLSTVEETMEMLGLVLFNYALTAQPVVGVGRWPHPPHAAREAHRSLTDVPGSAHRGIN